MAVTVDQLIVGDDAPAWRDAGFAVDDDGTCRIGTVRIRLTGADGPRHLHRWTLRGVDPDITEIDGVATTCSSAGPADPATHASGVSRIDHVVLTTPDIDRTVAALVAIGLDPRRVRDDAERYPHPMRQVFFRMGEVILELVGPQEPEQRAPERPAVLWGLALVADDLDGLAERLGPERVTAPKAAVQPGRRIATLRTRSLGISTAIAYMTPDPTTPGRR